MDLAVATALTWRHLGAKWIWKESTIAAVLDLNKNRELVLDLEKIRVRG